MRKELFFFIFLAGVMSLTERAYPQERDSARPLGSIQRAYAGLRDYTCDVNIHFDLEGLDTPDMRARIYYKSPDKIKVDSKGIFFLPREGAVFNPGAFKPDDYDVIFIERLEGGKAVRLRLAPKKIQRTRQDVILTVDTERNVIREAAISQPGGRIVKAGMTYGAFDGFNLPTHVRLQIDIPPAEPNGMRAPGPFERGERRLAGTVDITYSNYRVNTGLRDSLFKEDGSKRPSK